MKKIYWISLLLATTLACTPEKKEGPASLEIFSLKINGTAFVGGLQNIPINPSIEIVFSAPLSPAAFETACNVQGNTGAIALDFAYSNQSSKVILQPQLAYETTYTLQINTTAIGAAGEALSNPVSLQFSTAKDDTQYALPPCTTASADCLLTAKLTGNNNTANFQYYSSFPVYRENIVWRDLEAAVIAVHGQNRNADDYFNYLMSALREKNIADKVLGIAPFFKNQSEAGTGDNYWSGITWRAGQNAQSPDNISSFSAIDQIIDHLGDTRRFPALKKVILIGHSSGALFVHLYAAANRAANQYPQLSFTYAVGESQYFYYPDGQRIDPTGNPYIPTACTGYDLWPFGYKVVPPYLHSTTAATFNQQFLERKVVYLLGNGGGSDNTLNTTDCNAVLLGSDRYQRGENMYAYLERLFPGTHRHQKIVINGLSHSGSGMYGAATFRDWLLATLAE